MAGMTIIVQTISRLLFPFVFLFGIYIVFHGHLTPGGGFPGGAVIVASIIMLILAYGVDNIQKRISFLQAEVIDVIGSVSIVVIGLIGILLGTSFLQNVFPLGEQGSIFSGGNFLLLYIGVGIKVSAGLLLIIYAMLFVTQREKK